MKTRFLYSLCGVLFLAVPGQTLRSQPAIPIQLSIAHTNSNIVLTWTNTGVLLQSAPGLTGVWSVITGAVSPRVIAPINPVSFFRLQATNTSPSFAALYVAPTFSSSIGDPFGCGCVSPENPNTLGTVGGAQDNGLGTVLLQTGELTQDGVALEIPGRGFNWRFEMRYRSGMSYSGPVGGSWDFNYNHQLAVQTNGNVLCVNGLGRVDAYTHNTNGTFTSPSGFFTQLTHNLNGTFTEMDRHGNTNFYLLPNSLGISQLGSISDRNGNQMTFQYNNASGQMTNVVDTLGRSISYAYDANGHLTNVTDFAGRVLRFTYDTNSDLTSMTSPVVSGTPNGNDFPSGKTTLYTYSSGYADPRFNHELLTVTAPNETAVSGPPRLIAQYNTNSVSTDAARLVSLTLGGTNGTGTPAGGTISFAYTSFGPAGSTDYATPVFQNTATDRNGNVTQYQFNQLGNVVSKNQYTRGIRAGDPAAYTNIFAYNADGLMIAKTNAELSPVQYVYDSGNSNRLAQGDLLQTIWQPGPRGGDQAQIVVANTYETNFNFIATTTDGRSNTMTFKYDSHGNKTNIIHRLSSIVDDYTYNASGQMTSHVLPDNGQGHRRMDAMTYYSSGPQTGYLQQIVVDSGGFNLTNSYVYNAAGVVTNFIDARGSNTVYIVNALNQVVRSSSRAVATTNGLVRYQRTFYYDANNNLIRTDTQNIDDGGNVVASEPSFTVTNVYDILNEPLATVQQVATNHFVTTACQYDANGNRTLWSSGMATSGLQTNNTVSTVYDERDLVYQKTLAPNDPNHSTTQYDYDGNRNPVSKSQGIESAPRITTYTYDGYDRLTTTTDAMGNVTTTHYDANGNGVSSELDGELVDVPGNTGNVRLSETAYTYDAENRRTVSDISFFDPVTQTDIGGGHAVRSVAYSANSQVLTNLDANTNLTVTLYDTANRVSMITDSKSNTVTYTYDADNNVIKKIEVDLSDLGSPSQTISTTNSYDGMGRLMQKVDNLGNTTRYAYDSRNNRLATTDGRGNVTRYAYDGLNRKTTTTRYLTSNGLGSGTAAGQIITSRTFDDNSRLTGQTDNNTNTTTYVYDALDRRIETVFADGTTNGTVYDVHRNPVTMADANGNVVNTTYDLNNRAISKAITPGPGISGTTSEMCQYDGLSRIVSATNDDSAVTRRYDSLSDVTSETQQVLPGGTAQDISSAYDAMGNLLSCNYPGGTVINYTYDPLNRLQMVTNTTAMIAAYSYFGRERVQRRDYGNGTRASFTYDRDRRLTNSTHNIIFSGTNLDSREYAWDAANNQTTMNDLLAAQNTRVFFYDSANRLVQSTNAFGEMSYTLDGVGNRLTGYTLAPGTDQVMNQYTTTPFDSRTYDANGNLTSAGPESLAYDYRNQLISCTNSASNVAVAFKYDCFGRRLEKSGATSTNRYCYAGWQEVEEQDGADTTLATYVYGNGIDELLSMDRGGQSYFYHADNLGSIRKVTDNTGTIVEQYNYDDFGTPSFFDGSGTPLSGTQIGNAILFTGRRYDAETGYYYYRTRYLDSLAGRFITRDPLGGWADRGNLGNSYSYVGNRPVSFVDPMGTSNVLGHYHFEELPPNGPSPLQPVIMEDPQLNLPGDNGSSGIWGNYHFEELTPNGPSPLQPETMEDPQLNLPGDNDSSGIWGDYHFEELTPNGPSPLQPETMEDPQLNLPGTSPTPDPSSGTSPTPDPGSGTSPTPDPGSGTSPPPDPGSGTSGSGSGTSGTDPSTTDDSSSDSDSDSGGGGGGGGGMCCFVKDTLINTPEGTEPIQDIKVGDYVLSYNENTQVVEPRKVTKLVRSRRADLVQFKFGTEVITCSCNHRFYTSDQRWVPADELTGRDILMRFQRDDDSLEETSFEIKSTPLSHSVPIFNITVDYNHDYFVGKSAILVHNAKNASNIDKAFSNFGDGFGSDFWDFLTLNPSGSNAGTSRQGGSRNVKAGQ